MAIKQLNAVEKWYFLSAALLFFVTAIAKGSAAFFGTESILSATHRLIGTSYRSMFGVLTVIEIAIAVSLLAKMTPITKHLIIGTFVVSGFSYHAAHYIAKIPDPCPCLGGIFSWSPWLSLHSASIAVSILILLTVASASLLIAAAYAKSPVNADR